MKLNEIMEVTAAALLKSIKNGRFTMDGSQLRIDGDFNCRNKGLVSLAGWPGWVGGNFSCTQNKLTTLEGGPRIVGGHFICLGNKLTSLAGAPEKINGVFDCSFNRLTTLEGGPRTVDGYFYCLDNKLTSLTGVPEMIGGGFNCSNNHLTSLKGIHKQIKSLNEAFYAAGNPIRSHVLGLLLIDGLKAVELDNKQVERILNSFLPNTRGNAAVIEAQSALLDAGLDEYAQL